MAGSAAVVGQLAVHALHLCLRLRSLEVGEVRRARERRPHAVRGDVDLARVGGYGEGLIGEPRPQVLPEVELASCALERQQPGGLHTVDAAQSLGDVVRASCCSGVRRVQAS